MAACAASWLKNTKISHTRRILPAKSETMNRTIVAQNRSFAASIAVPATPPKPKSAAITARTRNKSAYETTHLYGILYKLLE